MDSDCVSFSSTAYLPNTYLWSKTYLLPLTLITVGLPFLAFNTVTTGLYFSPFSNFLAKSKPPKMVIHHLLYQSVVHRFQMDLTVVALVVAVQEQFRDYYFVRHYSSILNTELIPLKLP